jgi:hypothetical protein
MTYAINTLKEMQEKGFIKRIGNGRLTRYRRFYETDAEFILIGQGEMKYELDCL